MEPRGRVITPSELRTGVVRFDHASLIHAASLPDQTSPSISEDADPTPSCARRMAEAPQAAVA